MNRGIPGWNRPLGGNPSHRALGFAGSTSSRSLRGRRRRAHALHLCDKVRGTALKKLDKQVDGKGPRQQHGNPRSSWTYPARARIGGTSISMATVEPCESPAAARASPSMRPIMVHSGRWSGRPVPMRCTSSRTTTSALQSDRRRDADQLTGHDGCLRRSEIRAEGHRAAFGDRRAEDRRPCPRPALHGRLRDWRRRRLADRQLMARGR